MPLLSMTFFKPYRPAILVFVVGLAITAVASGHFAAIEKERVDRAFEFAATETTRDIEAHFQELLHGVAEIAALFETLPEADHDDFAIYAKSLLKLHPHLHVLAWAPRVPVTELAGFEARQRRLQPGFAVRLIAAPAPDGEAVPITFVETAPGESNPLGLDLASAPLRRAALEQARDSGAPTLTALVTLSASSDDDGFLTLVPVYRPGMPRERIEDRRRALVGYAVGVLRQSELMGEALARLAIPGLDVDIEDRSPVAQERFLYHRLSDSDQGFSIDSPEHQARMQLLAGTRTAERRLAIQGRDWAVIYHAAPGAFRGTGHEARLAGLFGAMSTFGLAGYLILLANRRRREQVAQAILAKSEARFRAIFHQAAVGIAQVGVDGRWLRLNDKLCAILGYTAAELQEKTFQQVTAPEDLAEDLERLQRVLSGEIETYTREERYRRKDGTPVWVRLTVSLVWQAEGLPEYFIYVVEDISDRKEAEHQLMLVSERNRLILESAGEGIFGLDRQGRHTFVNPAAARLLGFDRPEELLGQPSHATWHHHHLDGTAYPEQNCPVASTLTDGKLHVGEDWFIRRDGSFFPVVLFSTPMRVQDEIIGAVVSFSDITERKEAEMALRRYAQVVKSTGDMLMMVDREQRVQVANPAYARLFGLSPEELRGRNIAEIVGPSIYAVIGPYLERTLAGEPQRFTMVRTFPDGSQRTLDTAYHPYYQDGEIHGVVAGLRDITQLLALEAEKQALAENNRLILESAGEGIFGLDRIGVHTFVNPAAASLLGYRPEELLGRPSHAIWHHHHPDGRDYEEEKCPMWRTLSDGETHSGEEWFIRRDGNFFPVVYTSTPIRVRGAITGAVVTFTDISARKEAEVALHRYAQVVKSSGDMLLMLDEHERHLVANPAYAGLFGMTPEELHGRSLAEVVGPDLYSLMAPHIERTLAGETQRFTLDREFPDGSERTLYADSRPYYHDGRISGLVAGLRDITQIIQLEEEKEALSEHNRLILESAGEGIFGLNRSGVHTFVNPAAAYMLGYMPKELLGQPSHAVWHHHHPDGSEYSEETCPIRSTLADGEVHSGEDWFIRKDGTFFPVVYSSTPMRDRDKICGAVVSFTDISERRQAEERLRLAAAVFEHSTEGVMITDASANVLAVNPAFTNITGYSQDEVIGQNPRLLQSGRHDRDFYRAIWAKILSEGHWQGEIWNRRKDGVIFPQLINITAVRDTHDRIINYVGVLTDLSDIKHVQWELDFLAHHDPLTGLPNRKLFNELLQHTILRSKRERGHFALMLLDLDQFKHVNDSLGHLVGDHLLVEVAERLKTELRGIDSICRIGGDEFNLLLDDTYDPEEVAKAAQRLIDSIARPFEIAGHTLYTGASIGIALYPNDGPDVATLQRNADSALYQAKGEGRGTYRFFANILAEAAKERLALETLLRQALESQQLALYYQPQVDLATGQVVGVEALARWHSPSLGAISPSRFIPLAEESGLIVPLGDWALHLACQQMRDWLQAGSAPARVAVNVSALQLSRGNLAASVHTALQDSGIDPGRLELEITESFIMASPEAAVTVLHDLKALGVRLSIDDFGTGYSSLTYLKRLPVDQLKVDQAFVRDMLEDDNDDAIVRAVIALGHSLGLEVLAEGVETAEHAERLLAHGCDSAQGWYYGRPGPEMPCRSPG